MVSFPKRYNLWIARRLWNRSHRFESIHVALCYWTWISIGQRLPSVTLRLTWVQCSNTLLDTSLSSETTYTGVCSNGVIIDGIWSSHTRPDPLWLFNMFNFPGDHDSMYQEQLMGACRGTYTPSLSPVLRTFYCIHVSFPPTLFTLGRLWYSQVIYAIIFKGLGWLIYTWSTYFIFRSLLVLGLTIWKRGVSVSFDSIHWPCDHHAHFAIHKTSLWVLEQTAWMFFNGDL